MKLKSLLTNKTTERILVENIINSTEKMKRILEKECGIPNISLTEEQKLVLLEEINTKCKDKLEITPQELLEKIKKW